MELTDQEKARACEIARLVVKPRVDQFKPKDKPVIRNERGFICQETFLGSHDDTLMCEITLQWCYLIAGAIDRIYQTVHVRLLVTMKDDGRFLRATGYHIPVWSKGEPRYCQQCGADNYTERYIAVADTSLHEY